MPSTFLVIAVRYGTRLCLLRVTTLSPAQPPTTFTPRAIIGNDVGAPAAGEQPSALTVLDGVSSLRPMELTPILFSQV